MIQKLSKKALFIYESEIEAVIRRRVAQIHIFHNVPVPRRIIRPFKIKPIVLSSSQEAFRNLNRQVSAGYRIRRGAHPFELPAVVNETFYAQEAVLPAAVQYKVCLLYTSDAADEL